MRRTFTLFATAAFALSLASGADAAACKDAKGKFTKCPAAAASASYTLDAKGNCHGAKGRMVEEDFVRRRPSATAAAASTGAMASSAKTSTASRSAHSARRASAAATPASPSRMSATSDQSLALTGRRPSEGPPLRWTLFSAGAHRAGANPRLPVSQRCRGSPAGRGIWCALASKCLKKNYILHRPVFCCAGSRWYGMQTAKQCRLKAAEMTDLAARSSPVRREQFLEMAEAWCRLAEKSAEAEGLTEPAPGDCRATS